MDNPLSKWPEIKRLAQEEIAALIWNEDPPEILHTRDRLKDMGYSEAKAVERIESVWLKTCLERDGFDREHFVRLLKELK